MKKLFIGSVAGIALAVSAFAGTAQAETLVATIPDAGVCAFYADIASDFNAFYQGHATMTVTPFNGTSCTMTVTF